jgi:hypothetical protein
VGRHGQAHVVGQQGDEAVEVGGGVGAGELADQVPLGGGRSFPRGAGFDFAGIVTEAASDVTGLAVGDEVWGFINAVRNPGPSVGCAAAPLAPICLRFWVS